jgi:hypothetical protein
MTIQHLYLHNVSYRSIYGSVSDSKLLLQFTSSGLELRCWNNKTRIVTYLMFSKLNARQEKRKTSLTTRTVNMAPGNFQNSTILGPGKRKSK